MRGDSWARCWNRGSIVSPKACLGLVTHFSMQLPHQTSISLKNCHLTQNGRPTAQNCVCKVGIHVSTSCRRRRNNQKTCGPQNADEHGLASWFYPRLSAIIGGHMPFLGATASLSLLLTLSRGRVRNGAGRARHHAFVGLIQRYVVVVENLPGGAVQFHLRPGIGGFRGHQVRLRGHQIALSQNLVVNGGRAQRELLRLGVQCSSPAHSRRWSARRCSTSPRPASPSPSACCSTPSSCAASWYPRWRCCWASGTGRSEERRVGKEG